MTIRPENTTHRDPMIHLLGAMSDGPGGYIEGVEAAGQRELVASTTLPSEAGPGDDAYLALGFTFGPADDRDPLFRPATLPTGWRKEGSDHSMWSFVVDEHGRRRVAVFYKAAYYDRRAFMRLTSVSSYANDLVERGGSPVFDEWCTREALTEAVRQIREDGVKYHEPTVAKADRVLAVLAQGGAR